MRRACCLVLLALLCFQGKGRPGDDPIIWCRIDTNLCS